MNPWMKSFSAKESARPLRPYSLVYLPAYTNEFHRPLGLALIQMLWDRSDPNGYIRHVTNDPLPNTTSHQVMLHLAFGDHQVANVATEIEAPIVRASTSVATFATWWSPNARCSSTS